MVSLLSRLSESRFLPIARLGYLARSRSSDATVDTQFRRDLNRACEAAPTDHSQLDGK